MSRSKYNFRWIVCKANSVYRQTYWNIEHGRGEMLSFVSPRFLMSRTHRLRIVKNFQFLFHFKLGKLKFLQLVQPFFFGEMYLKFYYTRNFTTFLLTKNMSAWRAFVYLSCSWWRCWMWLFYGLIGCVNFNYYSYWKYNELYD